MSCLLWKKIWQVQRCEQQKCPIIILTPSSLSKPCLLWKSPMKVKTLILHNKGAASIPNESHLVNEQTSSVACHSKMDITKDYLSHDFVHSNRTVLT